MAKTIINSRHALSSTQLNDYDLSVSMCVYEKDNPLWFELAVNSVMNQTYKPNEIVIVVDGPIPKLLNEIVNKYEKEYCELFNVVRLEKNMGHGNARRVGLENCKNELVALMDADDISSPERFEKEVEVFVSNQNISIVGSNVSEFVNSPEDSQYVREVQVFDEKIKADLKKRCPMNQPTVMFKKTDIQAVGGYVDWFCNEDYYLWIRMANAGFRFANIDESLVYMRVGEDSYQRRGGIKYFKSEARLQKYMYDKSIISFQRMSLNISKRFVVQVLLPNKLREYVFKKFARK